MKKGIIISSIVYSLIMSSIVAAPNDLFEPNNPSSNVTLINNVTVINQELNLNNFNTISYNNAYILNFTINNNHPNGFNIHINSKNGGKLIGSNTDGDINSGETISYTISTIHMSEDDINMGGDNQTYWGFTESYNHADLTLTQQSLETPITITFSGITHQITQATRHFAYRILLQAEKKPELFSGTLTDEITISISLL